jgi:hypothetical protein
VIERVVLPVKTGRTKFASTATTASAQGKGCWKFVAQADENLKLPPKNIFVSVPELRIEKGCFHIRAVEMGFSLEREDESFRKRMRRRGMIVKKP